MNGQKRILHLALSYLSIVLMVSIIPMDAQSHEEPTLAAEISLQEIPPSATGPILVEADRNHLILKWYAPSYEIVTRELQGRTVQQFSMTGCPPAGRPGEPQLPNCTVLLGIPPDALLHLRILEQETISVPGDFSLPPLPSQEVVEEPSPERPPGIWPAGRVWVEGPTYRQDALFPLEPAHLGEPAFLRHQRIVPLAFSPLQYRPLSGEILYNRYALIEITFSQASEPMGYIAEPAEFEETLRRNLLNYRQARHWRRTTSSPLDLPPSPPDPGYRIPLDRAGIYVLTYDQLEAAGLPVVSLDPRNLRLFRFGEEIAIQVQGEGDGSFDPEDVILFYGRPITNSRYTDHEVYWLTYGGDAGLRMAQRDGTPHGTAPVPPSFSTTEHLEENVFYRPQMPWFSDHDHWWWTYTYPEGAIYTQDFVFPSHPLAPELYEAQARMRLFSWTRDGGVNPDHHIRVYLNDVLVDELWWDGRMELTPTFAFSSTLLQEGENTVRVEAPGDTGAFAHFNIYDWVELEQRRLFQAEENQIAWTGDIGVWEYHLKAFSETEILLLDISDPDLPIEIISTTIVPMGPTYTLRFEDDVAQETRYLAAASEAWLEPSNISAATPADLRNPVNRADYLIVSHGDFYTQALALESYRSGQGLQAMAVRLTDLFDLFDYGRTGVDAIRTFLAYTYDNWTAPAPSYVVLLGDGHYDPKDYLGYGVTSFIPPYLIDVDPWIGETAADNRYVCLSGEDTLPDMHLGRLPVNTPDQAQLLLNKIVGYENAPPPIDWRYWSTFVTDNADQAGDFPFYSDDLIDNHYPSPYEAERIYLGITHPITDAESARDDLVAAINEGRLFVNYIGHAGPGVWASERLLDNADLSDLDNGPYYPVALPMTCYEGSFHYPYDDPSYLALAERFLRAEGKGWVASWSPSGLGVATGHHYLDKGFFEGVFAQDIRRLGPATYAGKLNLYQTGAWLDLLDTYTLLGDPAMSLAVLTVDLSVEKRVQPTTPLLPGDPVTFTLRLANSGPATAHNVVLTDVLPAPLISHTIHVEGITISQRPGLSYTWATSDLVAGQVGTITIAAYIAPDTPAGILINQATATTSAADRDLQNNVDFVTLLIAAGDPHQITATASPAALPADGVALSLIQAEVTDAAGHPVADGTTVLFTTDAGSFLGGADTYQSETGRGIAEALLQASTEIVTATVSVAAGSAWNQLELPFEPLPPYTVTLQAEPSAIAMTGTAVITATLLDVVGHPVAEGTPVTLTTSLGVIAPTQGNTSDGIVTATLQGTGIPGWATVVASSGGAAGVTEVRIGAGSGITLSLVASPTTILADGQNIARITATLFGPGGGLLTETRWVSFSTTLGDIPPQAQALSGTVTVSLTAGTLPGQALIAAWTGGASNWTAVRLMPGEANNLVLTATPPVIPVDGHLALLQTTVTDAWGNPVVDGTPVLFSTTLGTVTPTQAVTYYGQAYARLSSGTQAGVATALAQAGDASDTAAVQFMALLAATLTLEIDPPALVADGVSTATVSAWAGDGFGNPVEDGTGAHFATTLGSIFPQDTVTLQGWATTTLTADTEVGTATVQVFLDQVQAQQAVPFIAGLPATVLVTSSPSQLIANGVSTATITAYLWDDYGHTVADGTPVSLSASLGTITPEAGWTQNGQVSATLQSTTLLGTSLVKASSGAAEGDTEVDFIPGLPDSIVVAADPTQIPADGTSTASISAYVEDPWGHPVATGTPITFSTSLGTITPEIVLSENGWGTTTLYAGTIRGWAAVEAEAGLALGQTLVEFLWPYRIYMPLVLKKGLY
jgi:uncharacterized repeat protein (TIGR01451 family)